MPRFPNFAERVSQITGSVFETYAGKMAAQGENLVRLHIGDTHLPVSYPLPVDASFLETNAGYNRYCNTFGIDALRDVLVEKLHADNEFLIERNNTLITSGATNALSISMMALVDPGDEVLILTPAWPFFFGMVKVAGGMTIEAPFYTTLFDNPDFDICDCLEEHVTDQTVAIYVNTPNNPSGKVMNENQLLQVAEFAREHDLWVISDEAYDGLTFDDLPHISIATLPGMFDRTLSMFTFSKSMMFAGLRLGYVVAAEFAIKALNKMMVHQLYSPSTIAQQMMVEPVRSREHWLPAVRKQYQGLRDICVDNLEIDFSKPEATYFIFFNAYDYLRGRDYWRLIEACLDAGVSVAPGDSFGQDFGDYIRLCFTGESQERLNIGIERLNRLFAGQG